MIKRVWLKRGTAALLSGMMVLSMASCGSSESGSKSESTSASSEEQGTEAEETWDTTAEGILARDYSESMTIGYAGIQCTDGFDYNHANAYWEWWTDTFNIEWEVTSLTYENWTQRINTWINADDIPDWCVWNFKAGDAATYVDQEMVKKLPDDWKEKYPNLAKAAENSPMNAYYEELFGGTYFLFRPAMANNFPAEIITNHISPYLRKDWADEAGYDLSANIEDGSITASEFIEYLRAVKAAGIVEYPWNNTSSNVGYFIDEICEHSGVAQSAFYLGEDGKYHWGPENDDVREAVRLVKEAYDEGLLYPEFYAVTGDDDMGEFTSSQSCAAIMKQGVANYINRMATTMENDIEDFDYYEDVAALVLTDDEGVNHQDPSTNYWACNIISPNISDEKLERLLSIWDYSCTEEGQLRIRLGFEGEDWEYDEDGNTVNLLADTEYKNTEGKYTTLLPITWNMFILSDDYSFINPSFTQEARDLVTKMYQKRSDVASSRDKEIDFNLLSYSSTALNQASMTYYDEYANLITKDGDFDENYDQWLADKKALIDPVLEELNAAFTE